MDMLHAPLVQEILSRLPVRSLMHCRLVCRLWRDITSNREFTRIHAAQSLAAIPGIMQSNTVYNYFELPYPNNEFFFIDRRINAHIPTYFPAPVFIAYIKEICLLDSCRGLLFLMCHHGYDNDMTLIVCNPLIRKFTEIPNHEFPDAINIFTDFDFGFCPKTESYKVLETSVWLVKSEGSDDKYLSEKYVYKLGDDSWKRIETDVYVITRRYGLASNINGAFHWIDQCWGDSLTVFNTEYDVFKDMPGPVDGSGRFSTGIIENCLSIINLHDNILDVWIMKEYWVSWEKFCVINLIEVVNINLEYKYLHYWAEGSEFLFLNNDQVQTYTLKENVFNTLLALHGLYNGLYKVVPHHDTLLPPLD